MGDLHCHSVPIPRFLPLPKQGILIEKETWRMCVLTGACGYCATDGPEQVLQLRKGFSMYTKCLYLCTGIATS